MTRVPSGACLACDYISVYPLHHPPPSSPTTCRICPPSQTLSRGSSTRIPRMAARFSPSQVQTLLSSPVTPVKARATASRLVMPPKYSGCPYFYIYKKAPQVVIVFTPPSRTDRAVLAVNGFAADGNMFVKKVKQRLEVHPVRYRRVSLLFSPFHLVSGTDTITPRICLSAPSHV